MPDAVTVDVAGLVRIRLDGVDRLQPAGRSWVDGALGPLAVADAPADVVLRVSPGQPRVGRRIEHGLALLDDGVWVGDRFGRGGVVPFDPEAPLRVDSDVAASVLADRLYLFAVHVALWRHGVALLRAGVVEMEGRRIAVSGWSGSGKTHLLLTMMARHGGRLLGDDVVAVLPGGVVAPVMADLTVRSAHAATIPMTSAPRLPGLRLRLRTWLDRLADHAGRAPGLSKLLAGLAEVVEHGGERVVGLDRLPGGRQVGTAGPLDRLVLLRPQPGGDAVAFLTGATDTYLLAHRAVAAVAHATRPAQVPADLLPPPDAVRTLVSDVVAGAEVVDRPAPLTPSTVAALAAELTR